MTLATCSNVVKFYQWPSVTLTGIYESPVDEAVIKNISWCNEGKQLVAIRSGATPILITAPKSVDEPMKTRSILKTAATAATFSPINNQMLAIGCGDGEVFIYDTVKQSKLADYHRLPDAVQFLDFSADSRVIAAGCISSYFYLYNCNGTPTASLQVPFSSSLSAMAFNRRSPNLLVSASKEGVVCVWDVATVQDRLICRDHSTLVTDVAFYDDYLSSVGVDGRLVSYDLRKFEEICICDLKTPLAGVAYLPNRIEMAISTCDGQIRSYDLRYMDSPLITVVAYSGFVKKIAFPIVQEEIASLFDKGDFKSSSCYSDHVDSIRSSLIPHELPPRPETVGFISETELQELVKSVEEHIRTSAFKLEQRMQQMFYAMRINTCKRFIALEETAKELNSFLKCLRQSVDQQQSQTCYINSGSCSSVSTKEFMGAESDEEGGE